MFTASNSDAANGEAGVATVLTIINEESGRPDWIARGHRAMVFQAEGSVEAADALPAIDAAKEAGDIADGSAVVTNLGIDPEPFIQRGVTSCFVECYAQAGDYPYGNIAHMHWQAKRDGWPHVVPTLGVYDAVDLAHYFALNGGIKPFAKGHWRGGPLAIYLAEGMSDTNSWPSLAGLFT